MENNAFTSYEFSNEKLFDYSSNSFPTILYAWDLTQSGECKINKEGSTFYGFVYEGPSKLKIANHEFPLASGMYFSFSGVGEVFGGKGILIERLNFKGVFMIGGPIEESGRLKYIDGCTDSLLIPPIKFGDPCLNALYFPPEINQTPHTHPSMRVGIIVSGKGECITSNEIIDLLPGQIFIIHEEGLHSFRTAKDEGMIVIAYHPDSDFGPENENHPMINRTIVEGVPANKIESIKTK